MPPLFAGPVHAPGTQLRTAVPVRGQAFLVIAHGENASSGSIVWQRPHPRHCA